MIKVEKLKKNYGEIKAVRGISFEVFKGEMFGIVGPDGAGKTTTIRVLCGLLNPNEGNINVLGTNVQKNRKLIQRKIGYLSQKFSLYGDLTVDENIEFFANIHNITNFIDQRNELLDFTKLTHFRDRLAEKLSGGMKQKLALACSLIHKPEILYLDEPTTGVDPVSRRDFWKILSDLQKDNITIVLTTPYLDEAERCNRVALMDQGKILALDTPANLKSRMDGEVLEIVCEKVRTAATVLKAEFDFDIQLFGDRLNIVIQNREKDVRAILKVLAENKITVSTSRIITPTLENLFINMIKKAS